MSDRDESISVENENRDARALQDSRESADRLRRRIIKAGAVAVPTIISLQSGTAWALSSCASRGRLLPTQEDLGDGTGNASAQPPPPAFEGFGDDNGVWGPVPAPNTQQRANRDFVISATSGQITDGDIQTFVTTPGSTTGDGVSNYPESGSVQDGDVIFLAAANPSCWTSFCNGPVGTGAVSYPPNRGCGPP